MQNSQNSSSPTGGKFSPYVGALVGAASAVSMQPGHAAVVGYADLNHVVLDGELFALPAVPSIRYNNKTNGCLSMDIVPGTAFSTAADYSGADLIGTIVGPGGVDPAHHSQTPLFYTCSFRYEIHHGFSFFEAGASHYGWARVTFDGPNDRIVVHEYAYESDARTAIVVGNLGNRIPEPSALALAAAGMAIGFGIRRRKRAAAR